MNTSPSSSTHHLDSVKPWLMTMAERGMFPLNSARLRATAVEQLRSVLGPEEPQEVQHLLDNLDAVTARWATRTSANPDTAATYKQRARRALEDYLEFQRDPTGFKPKVVRLLPEGVVKRPERKSQSETAPPSMQPERAYPLDEGAEFRFRLPARGVATREVRRIAWHLLTLATDFDGTNPPVLRGDD